jgi:hypothetical protein
MHGQQNDKYTEMHGQQNDKYNEMHGQQNVKIMLQIWTNRSETLINHIVLSSDKI